ncbi:MAG: MBL fold metallo-hydrolase [Chloroflexota bacterium]
MKQITPDLWQTAQEKQFGTLNVHAYLLKREEGNLLFYNPRSTKEFQQITELGGVHYHYLSHGHEVDPTVSAVRRTFDAQLCCHANVARYLNEEAPAHVYFEAPEREIHAGTLEVLHTLGHTDNNVCFRYASPHGKTYLFMGDTIYLDNGSWNTLIMESEGGSRHALAKSLSYLRGFDVDVVICSVAIGESRIVEVTTAEWHSIIDERLAHLRAETS